MSAISRMHQSLKVAKMPDALLLANDDDVCFKLESFFKENNFRFKFTREDEHLTDWLKTLPFDLLMIPANLPFEFQQKYAFQLWDLNPQAFLVLYDPNDTQGLNAKRTRLLGASLATGEKFWDSIQRIAFKILGCKYIKKSDFKVLVVEDLDAARDIICTYVESLGYPHVCGVASAGEALELLSKGKHIFDCVMTDERMPHMAGHELISKIRLSDDHKDMPLIVLTAHGTPDCLMQALKVGASGFLTKPPIKTDLIRELARAMRVKVGLEKARLVEEQNADEIVDLLSQRL